MGGGKLNHNKSWNTQSMRHMEQVWKAERRQKEEEAKIKELQRQKVEEAEVGALRAMQGRREERLDWMYQPIGRGEMVAPSVEEMLETRTETVEAGKAESEGERLKRERDTAAKVRDDPLLAIKRAELERMREALRRKKLLEKAGAGRKRKEREEGEERERKRRRRGEGEERERERHRGERKERERRREEAGRGEEDEQARLRRMEENARWAEEMRRKRAEQDRERADDTKEKVSGEARFLNKVQAQAYMGSSERLEDRLRRNRHFIART